MIEIELTEKMVKAVANNLMVNFEERAFSEQDYLDIAKETINALFAASSEMIIRGCLYGRVNKMLADAANNGLS